MPGKKRDTYAIFGTYTATKQFRRGERLKVMFVPNNPGKLECLGPSLKGKPVVKWVAAEDLANLKIEWVTIGRKREDLAQELASIQQNLPSK